MQGSALEADRDADGGGEVEWARASSDELEARSSRLVERRVDCERVMMVNDGEARA